MKQQTATKPLKTAEEKNIIAFASLMLDRIEELYERDNDKPYGTGLMDKFGFGNTYQLLKEIVKSNTDKYGII